MTIKSKNEKKIRFKKAILIIAIFLFLIICFIGYGYYKTAKVIKSNVADIIKEISDIEEVIATQNFTRARNSLNNIKKDIFLTQKEISKLDLLKILPPVKNEVIATEKILKGASAMLSSSEKFVDIGEEMYQNLGITGKTFQEVDFSKLNSDQKGNIVVAIRQAAPILDEIAKEAEDMEDGVNILINSPWTKYLPEDILNKAKKFPEIKEIFDLANLGVKYLPDLIGYPAPADYLILLQNNTELRPTGGFIGTYGLLQMQDGRMKNFFIDDVYNLDKAVKKTMFVKPPWQLKKWNDTTQWFLRDANWSPDFPTSAKQAQWFYDQESKKSRNQENKVEEEDGLEFAGAIALTPNVITDVLELVGPITTHNITFTGGNLIDLLEYRVEVEFKKLGIPMSERKIIIQDLAVELQNRLKHLSVEQFLTLAQIIKKNLDEKQILLFFNDKELQNIIKERNWAGDIRSTNSDYLMVVDANIGSLKTDLVMNKKIEYEIKLIENASRKGGGNASHSFQESAGGDYLIAKVTITYVNNGKFAWNLTRYRTYTRIYVPQGSELIKAEGMMANDRTKKVGEVAVEEKFGKTVFGAFIAIEPKETKTLTFEYKLPDYIKEQLDSGKYGLLVQKQPGTEGHKLIVDIDGDVWKGDLRMDRELK